MRRERSNCGLVLLAAALLVGQGAALHHDHASAADCLPGPCVDHGVHAKPPDTLSDDESCLLCDLLGHGRSVVAAPAPGVAFAARPCAHVAEPATHAHVAPHLAGLRARAPPSPA